MSVHVASLVWHYSAPAVEKIVLLKLADCADDSGRNAFPSVARIARECGVSARHVQKVLAKYRELGLLKVQTAADARLRRPTTYTLDLKFMDGGGEQRAGVNSVQGCTPCTRPLNSVHPRGEPRAPKTSFNHHKNRHGASDIDGEFDVFWRVYPSRRPHTNPRKPTRAKFESAIKRGVPAADMIRGARNYAAYVKRERIEPKYIKQAETWLNQECWTEYQDEPPSEGPSRGQRL